MNSNEIEAIRARCEKATEGPWNPGDGVNEPFGVRDGRGILIADIPHPTEVGAAISDFIAHARTDIPRLLALVDELRRALEIAKENELPCFCDPGSRLPHIPWCVDKRHEIKEFARANRPDQKGESK